MIRRTITTVLLTAAIALPTVAEPLIDVDELAWSMTMRPKAMAQSELGRAWAEEVSTLHDDWNEKYAMMTESLGIDLFKTSDTIVMFNEDYEVGAFSAVVSLGDTAGNIEGALLSVPGYESWMLDDETILNVIPWEHRGRDGDRLYSAVVRLDDGKANYFVAGLDRGRVEGLVRRLQGGQTDLELSADDASALMTMHAYRPAPKRQLRGPHAGLLGMLNAIDMSVVEDDQVTVRLSAEIENETRARQVYEMAQGWTTFLTIVAGFNEDAEPTHEVMEQLRVDRVGQRVSLSLTCEPEAMIAAIRNLAIDQPFDGREQNPMPDDSDETLDLDDPAADN